MNMLKTSILSENQPITSDSKRVQDQAKKPKKRKRIFFLYVMVVVIITITVILFSDWNSERYIEHLIGNYPSLDNSERYGSIEGSLSYPGEGIPPQGVCAENTKTKELHCTYEMVSSDQYLYGYGYKLQLFPGEYHLFAHLTTQKNEKIGYTNEEQVYYSEFVTCGMLHNCPSHKPIKISLTEKQVLTGVDPIDWYKN